MSVSRFRRFAVTFATSSGRPPTVWDPSLRLGDIVTDEEPPRIGERVYAKHLRSGRTLECFVRYVDVPGRLIAVDLIREVVQR